MGSFPAPAIPADTQTLITGFTLLEELHRELDGARADVEQAVGGRPLCVQNCGKCCETNVPQATAIEAKYLFSQASLMPRSRDIRRRALGWIAEQHPNLRLHNKVVGRRYTAEEQRELYDDNKKIEHTGCPFLAPDKSCMVYEARPLVCRGYGATWAADPWCPRPLAPTETPERRMGIRPGGPRGQQLQRIRKALMVFLSQRAPEMLASSWFPTLVAREQDRDEVIALHREGKVADIKLAMGMRQPPIWHDDPETAPETIPLMEVATNGHRN